MEEKEARLFTVLYFPVKIVEIERFAFRAAILRACQNYLGGRGRFGRKSYNPRRPPPRYI